MSRCPGTLLKNKLWRTPRTNGWIVGETGLMLSASLLIAYFFPAPLMLPVFSILSFLWAVDSAWHAHFLGQRWLSATFTHWDQAGVLALIAFVSAILSDPSEVMAYFRSGESKR